MFNLPVFRLEHLLSPPDKPLNSDETVTPISAKISITHHKRLSPDIGLASFYVIPHFYIYHMYNGENTYFNSTERVIFPFKKKFQCTYTFTLRRFLLYSSTFPFFPSISSLIMTCEPNLVCAIKANTPTMVSAYHFSFFVCFKFRVNVYVYILSTKMVNKLKLN